MRFLDSGGKFISIGDKIRLPDDVTVGYIVEHLLGKNLTVIEQFHSHLEPMKFIKPYLLHEQVSLTLHKGCHYASRQNIPQQLRVACIRMS